MSPAWRGHRRPMNSGRLCCLQTWLNLQSTVARATTTANIGWSTREAAARRCSRRRVLVGGIEIRPNDTPPVSTDASGLQRLARHVACVKKSIHEPGRAFPRCKTRSANGAEHGTPQWVSALIPANLGNSWKSVTRLSRRKSLLPPEGTRLGHAQRDGRQSQSDTQCATKAIDEARVWGSTAQRHAQLGPAL